MRWALLSQYSIYIPFSYRKMSNVIVFSSPVTPLQWHYRLGHASFEWLHSLGLSLKLSNKPECESCDLDKHHRLYFLSRVNNKSPRHFTMLPLSNYIP